LLADFAVVTRTARAAAAVVATGFAIALRRAIRHALAVAVAGLVVRARTATAAAAVVAALLAVALRRAAADARPRLTGLAVVAGAFALAAMRRVGLQIDASVFVMLGPT
jgi:hypothetical protein